MEHRIEKHEGVSLTVSHNSGCVEVYGKTALGSLLLWLWLQLLSNMFTASVYSFRLQWIRHGVVLYKPGLARLWSLANNVWCCMSKAHEWTVSLTPQNSTTWCHYERKPNCMQGQQPTINPYHLPVTCLLQCHSIRWSRHNQSAATRVCWLNINPLIF